MFIRLKKNLLKIKPIFRNTQDDVKPRKGIVRGFIFEDNRPAGDNWRITILNAILYGTFILSLFSATAGSINQINDGRHYYVIFYAACVLMLASAAFLKTMKYSLRVSVFLMIFYLVAISELYASGITGDGDHFMTAIVVLSGILLNIRTGLVMFFISILSMVFIAWLTVSGYIRLEPFLGEVSYRARNWASAIIAYAFMTTAMFISVVFMRRKMEETIRENEKSIRELIKENRIRKKREQSLNIFKKLLTTSYDSIAYISRKNRIVTANDAFQDIFGGMLPGKKGERKGEWLCDEVSEKNMIEGLAKSHNGVRSFFEYRIKNTTGVERCMEILLSPFAGNDGNPRGIVFIARDITDKVRMEEEFLEMNEEGSRIFSMALHDGLSHFLLDVAFRCNGLIKLLKIKNPALLKDALGLETQINQAIDLTRNISKGLFPEPLKFMNLHEAIGQKKKLLEESFNIKCHTDADSHLVVTDRTSGMHLNYILQEAVLNIIKHSKATEAGISLVLGKSDYELVISDNGVGIGTDTRDHEAGTGRRIMEYRARKIGGSISIKTVAGKRTEVTCTLPHSLFEFK